MRNLFESVINEPRNLNQCTFLIKNKSYSAEKKKKNKKSMKYNSYSFNKGKISIVKELVVGGGNKQQTEDF